MDKLNNSFLIYFLILLCINLISFYLFYKLNQKVNVANQKIETLDKFLLGVLLKNAKQGPNNSEEDNSEEDNSEEDKSEEDKSEEDKSEKDKSEKDKSEKDKSEKDKYNKKKPGKKSNLRKIIEQGAENSD
jgi:hypothetical protein